MNKIPFLNLEEDLERENEKLKYQEAVYSRNYLLSYLKQIGRPLRIKEILAANRLKNLNNALKHRLRAMIRQGQLLKVKRGYVVADEQPLVEGYVVTSRYDYGFLVVENQEKDLFLNPQQMRQVLEHDRVQARIVYDKLGRKEGIIVKVIERLYRRILGKVYQVDGQKMLLPANDKLKALPLIDPPNQGTSFVVAEPVERNQVLYAQIVEFLPDWLSLPVVEKLILDYFKLASDFPLEVLNAAAQRTTLIEKQQREDWQDLPFVTIDGEDARDFDDAVYGQKLNDRVYQLYVAIADVAHYVLPDDLLDQEAQKRGNSVYFPEKVLPMLPERLSNDLCSLKPMLPRLAIGCSIQIDRQGNVVNFRFAEVIIKSQARLTYDQVYDFLEYQRGNYSDQIINSLRCLKNIYVILREKRKKHFALDFDRPEVKLSFEQGHLIAINPVVNHYVYQIIEECMLLTNVCAARWLSNYPLIYRVHVPPKPDKLEELQTFLGKLGIKLGKKNKTVTTEDYAKLIQTIEKRKDQNLLKLKILRSLNKACYSYEKLGHFALNYPEYIHFTSPIRRYSDLYNHRLLKAKLHHQTFNAIVNQTLPTHCSERERSADEASEQMLRWYQCQYLARHLNETYLAIIVGLNEDKIWVELKSLLIEGSIATSTLGRIRMLPDKISLQRLNKNRIIYTIGNEVTVKVDKVDVFKKEIILRLV